MSSDSISDVVVDTEDNSNKRAIIDTSFSPESSVPASKRSNNEQLPGTPDSNAVVTEAILVSTLERMFEQFENKMELKFININSRLDSIDSRLNSLEQDASSRDICIENVLSRVDELEDKGADLEQRITSIESAADSEGLWQPVGSPETKILLLGDSNSGGKIRFGDERGTLGRALPGSCNYCPKFEDLPPLDSPLFGNVSDLVLSVGTNNIKAGSCDPESLVRRMYLYTRSIINTYPGIHVFLPGILPVHCAFIDEALNSKIKLYNHYLKDMCNNLKRSYFIDMNVFWDPNGSLKQNLSKGDTDPLHLNDQGIKLFASRFKHALRAHLNLPLGVRRPPQSVQRTHSGGNVPLARDQGYQHVNRGARGGRGSYSARRGFSGGRN